MGTDGCVAFQFKHCGQMIFAPGTERATLMDAAMRPAEMLNTNDDGSIGDPGCSAGFASFGSMLPH